MAKGLRELLMDLIEWGEIVDDIVGATTPDTIVRNRRDLLALERAVEVVGEICGRLLRQQEEWSRGVADDDLHRAYDMRHRLAHGYDAVSPARLHSIARVDVAALTVKARRWLSDLDAGQP